MPAYRSSAEAEIRTAVVERLRRIRPHARIMHEVNCAVFGPNRIDVLAVDSAEIISVEIKSAKDKLDRLPAQIASMRSMSHHVIAAIHEKFLVQHRSSLWGAHCEIDGEYYCGRAPEEAENATVWVFPERKRAITEEPKTWDLLAKWHEPKLALQRANIASIDMLWAEEMRVLCTMVGVPANSRSTREGMMSLLKWHCTGEQITRGVCALLRHRECIEGDPPDAASLPILRRQS